MPREHAGAVDARGSAPAGPWIAASPCERTLPVAVAAPAFARIACVPGERRRLGRASTREAAPRPCARARGRSSRSPACRARAARSRPVARSPFTYTSTETSPAGEIAHVLALRCGCRIRGRAAAETARSDVQQVAVELPQVAEARGVDTARATADVVDELGQGRARRRRWHERRGRAAGRLRDADREEQGQRGDSRSQHVCHAGRAMLRTVTRPRRIGEQGVISDKPCIRFSSCITGLASASRSSSRTRWSARSKRRVREAVEGAGGLVVIVPPSADPESWQAAYERLDGVLLMGGADVDPSHYGAERHPLTETRNRGRRCDRPRTRTRRARRWQADPRRLPRLAGSRGGRWRQPDPGRPVARRRDDHALAEWRDVTAHAARASPRRPRRARQPRRALLGDASAVNSYHHQAVDRLGDEHARVAHASDGVVEAIEATNGALRGRGCSGTRSSTSATRD